MIQHGDQAGQRLGINAGVDLDSASLQSAISTRPRPAFNGGERLAERASAVGAALGETAGVSAGSIRTGTNEGSADAVMPTPAIAPSRACRRQ